MSVRHTHLHTHKVEAKAACGHYETMFYRHEHEHGHSSDRSWITSPSPDMVTRHPHPDDVQQAMDARVLDAMDEGWSLWKGVVTDDGVVPR